MSLAAGAAHGTLSMRRHFPVRRQAAQVPRPMVERSDMRIVPPRRPRTRALAATLAVVASLGTGGLATASHAAPRGDASTVAARVAGADPQAAPAFVAASDRALAEPASARPGHERVSAAAVDGAAPARVMPAADAALTQLPSGADCPAGTSRASTLYYGGFEDPAPPQPSYTQGWSVVTGGRSGSYAAKSSINAGDPSTQPSGTSAYWPLALPYLTTPGGRTVLRYAIKGDYPEDAAYVAVNAESGWAAPTSSWGIVTLDVTGAITAGDSNTLDVRFANFPARPATNSTIYLDDVEVYTCAPASRTRGDFDGDGIADVLTVNASGDLQLWPGTGDFHLKSPVLAGTGWGGATWLGSPGDLNGDGRADIMARFSDGRLMAYYGDGTGHFTGGMKQIGTGWNGMSAIVPMSDINGDGRFDVMGRDAAGNLRRYWFLENGTMTGGVIVGVGFHVFTSMFTMGDYDGDGRWDVTGIVGNGDMKVYTTLATGALWGTGQKIGNGWNFKQVSSSGDFDRNGRADVVGVAWNGTVYGYPVLGPGKWGGTVITGTGFGGFRLIL